MILRGWFVLGEYIYCVVCMFVCAYMIVYILETYPNPLSLNVAVGTHWTKMTCIKPLINGMNLQQSHQQQHLSRHPQLPSSLLPHPN